MKSTDMKRPVSPRRIVLEGLRRLHGIEDLSLLNYTPNAIVSIKSVFDLITQIMPIKWVDIWYSRDRPALLNVEKVKILLIENTPGAPMTSALIEELSVCGVKKLVYIGYAGSLSSISRQGI